MSTRPRWSEPSLFDPEQIRYDHLRLRLDVALSGPTNQIETWCTVTDELGGWVRCEGGNRALLLPHGRSVTTELAGDLFDWTLRRLNPF